MERRKLRLAQLVDKRRFSSPKRRWLPGAELPGDAALDRGPRPLELVHHMSETVVKLGGGDFECWGSSGRERAAPGVERPALGGEGRVSNGLEQYLGCKHAFQYGDDKDWEHVRVNHWMFRAQLDVSGAGMHWET